MVSNLPAKNRPRFPLRDGVGASVIVLPEGRWPSLLAYLAFRFPTITTEEIAARMGRGDVFDADGVPLGEGAPYQAQQTLFYYRHIEGEPRIPFEEEVIFQDAYLVAVDKPHYLPATPGGRYLQETLLVRLRRRLGIETLAPMHRLDRETAGVMLFSVQPETRARYAQVFAERQVTKGYEAIAPKLPDLVTLRRSRIVEADHFMCMREVAGEVNAETRIERIDAQGVWARYRLQPVTGKKHQLRVHMAALGVPILNDQMYPTLVSKAELERDDFLAPLQLLAKEISFIDPITQENRHFVTRRELLPLDAI